MVHVFLSEHSTASLSVDHRSAACDLRTSLTPRVIPENPVLAPTPDDDVESGNYLLEAQSSNWSKGFRNAEEMSLFSRENLDFS